MSKITPFLMFTGQAEEAINYYTSLFAPSEIINITRYGPDQDGPEGSVLHAVFSLKGQQVMAIDSPIEHAFNFTPSLSLYVNCDSEGEIDHLFEQLSQGGEALMPLDAYPFSQRFAWVSDKYGVSWQLNLAESQE